MSTITGPKGHIPVGNPTIQPAATPKTEAPAEVARPRQTDPYASSPTPTAEPSALARSAGNGPHGSVTGLRMNELGQAAKTAPVQLDPAQLGQVVAKKATCPFIGAAVQQGALPVRNNAETPLASIADVTALGNTGGGDLGEVLKIFAKGNHSRMPSSGGGEGLTPAGHFSLDFPGSQGSHPGHSGILQGDPTQRDSGRFSAADMDRLLSRAKDGVIRRSDIGKFIAENLVKDPDSKVFGAKVTGLLLGDIGHTLARTGPALMEAIANRFRQVDDHTENVRLFEALTKTLGEDNLVGSAGEFGLLMALLANSPKTRNVDGEPAISVEDLKAMFVEKRFPDGWESWPKTRHDWVVATTALTLEAGKEYARLKH
ncbi:MAG: hypothetical protein AB2A00_07200 [Myxococcota bacterium]